ncbi:universal stress protein [Nonomuraea sp. NPDC049400]|uniref:universal stress protein n=1 Tax=Nonomuraea sp. NPDC049400 TaxID=3364352 RepID=UPI0037B23E72
MAGPIVVGVDGSESANAAAEWAAADALRRRLPLKVVHVCERRPGGIEGRKYCLGVLEAAADSARAVSGDVEVSTELAEENVVDFLIGQSASADSLVLGSRGSGGFAGLVLGSVGLAVAGHAEGPVVIVRGPAAAEHGQIVVGDDGSESAQAAMTYAVEQARARHARLLAIHAWQAPLVSAYAPDYGLLLEDAFQEEARAARERMTRWRTENPDVEITEQHVREHPVPALGEASATADLVVVGSRGLGAFASAVLGSVSHGVLHRAACPVAVVRPRARKP